MEKIAGIEEDLFRVHRTTTPELGDALQRHIPARRAHVDEATLSRRRDVLQQAAREEAASYRHARHICS